MRHDGDVYVDHLDGISSAAARAIADHRGRLHVDDVESLSEAGANALIAFQGELHIGEDRFSKEAERMLASRSGDLFLDCYNVTKESALILVRVLAGVALHLDLGTESDPALDVLADHQGSLHIQALELSEAAARSLARHQADLHVCTPLSDDQLRHLVKHKGSGLSVSGISANTDEAFMSFAGHEGWLQLADVVNISDDTASALSEHAGDLFLPGVIYLEDCAGHYALAERMAAQAGTLRVGLHRITTGSAERLARHEGTIHLGRGAGFDLASDSAKALAEHRGVLRLDALGDRSRVASSLGVHHGELHLTARMDLLFDSKETIRGTEARSLANHHGDIHFFYFDFEPEALRAFDEFPHDVYGMYLLE